MTDLIRIAAVEPLEERWLRLTFSDGAVKDVDLSGLLARGGVFTAVRDDRSAFERVEVNPETRTIEWATEGVDLDPNVLYGRAEPASGAVVCRRVVREPAAV